MSYLVLARKWRPQKFDEVVGQEHITQTLKNSILKDKLAHAYLFVGPRGVGKTSCARILAKSINCKEAPTVTPCGKCSACKEISNARSFDVIEIDGASNRGIDEIRTLRENVKFSPVSGRYKIYIIDEVHMLTQEAFNALLKTLEEPPEHVKFIFATTRPDKVLSTILSRCQRFEFNRIPTLKIISKLEEICEAEKISIERDVFFNIARISDGSMRDAESVLDQLVSFSKDKIKPGDVVEIMGLIGEEIYFDFLQAIKDKDTQFCIDFVAKLFSRGKNIAKFLEGLLWHLRNLMLAKIMKSNLEELLDLPVDIVKRVVEQSKILSLAEIISLFNAVTSTQNMAKKIGSFRISLEVMIVKLTQPLNLNPEPVQRAGQGYKQQIKNIHPAEAALDSQERKFSSKIKLDNVGSVFIGPKNHDSKKQDSNPKIKDSQEQKPIQELSNKEAFDADTVIENGSDKPTVDLPQIDFKTIFDGWNKLVEDVSKVKISVGTYLQDSKPVSLEKGVLTIGFPKRSVFYKEAVEQKHNQKIVNDRINSLFNTMISLRLELCQDISSQNESQDKSDSDYLKSALDTFQGRIFKSNL